MSAIRTGYRVTCEKCDKELVVPSQTVAEDLVDEHEADANCDGAEWEAVEDD